MRSFVIYIGEPDYRGFLPGNSALVSNIILIGALSIIVN